jgi:protein-S-isoprenylcysteine O-methyltransferase Ste14
MNAGQQHPRAGGIPVSRHVRAVLLLPFMNTVLIPGVILLVARDQTTAGDGLSLSVAALGLLLAAAGIALVVRSIALFVRIGRGTLAPWDPTRELITTDVYRFSRNPMKSGLFLVLLGECLLSGSRALMVWAAAFIIANVVYIRWFEERGLARRFGADYRAYCERVPRWFGLRGLRRPRHTLESTP